MTAKNMIAVYTRACARRECTPQRVLYTKDASPQGFVFIRGTSWLNPPPHGFVPLRGTLWFNLIRMASRFFVAIYGPSRQLPLRMGFAALRGPSRKNEAHRARG